MMAVGAKESPFPAGKYVIRINNLVVINVVCLKVLVHEFN